MNNYDPISNFRIIPIIKNQHVYFILNQTNLIIGRQGKGLTMGGTVGGATTSSPEYLTETQYYSPSDFEDVSRRAKSQEETLIGILTTLNCPIYCKLDLI